MTDIRDRAEMYESATVAAAVEAHAPTAAGAPDEEVMAPKLGVIFWICVGWLALNVLGVIFASILPLPNPQYENPNAINAGPALSHLLGTDDLGRDIFSRIVYGGRVSLAIAFGSVAIGMAIGGTLGLVAGYLRGAWETALNSAALMLLAFPPLVAIMAVVAFWGQTLTHITVVIGILASPLLFRVIYASTISYSTREFVTAARGLGATSYRVIFRELLPNVLPAIVSFALIGVATVIILEGALAFLGLSVQPPSPSWGNMINEGRAFLQPPQQNIWLTLWPVVTIVLFLMALNFIADKLRQRFDINEGRL